MVPQRRRDVNRHALPDAESQLESLAPRYPRMQEQSPVGARPTTSQVQSHDDRSLSFRHNLACSFSEREHGGFGDH